MSLVYLKIHAVVKNGAVLTAAADAADLTEVARHFGGKIESGLFVIDGAAGKASPKKSQGEKMLTPLQVAKQRNVSKGVVYRAILKKKLPATGYARGKRNGFLISPTDAKDWSGEG